MRAGDALSTRQDVDDLLRHESSRPAYREAGLADDAKCSQRIDGVGRSLAGQVVAARDLGSCHIRDADQVGREALGSAPLVGCLHPSTEILLELDQALDLRARL